MASFVACPSCSRLIHPDERSCPYCASTPRSCRATALNRGTSWTSLGLTALLCACGSAEPDDSTSSSAGSESATSSNDSVSSGSTEDSTSDSTDESTTDSTEDSTTDSSSDSTEDSTDDTSEATSTTDEPTTAGSFYAGAADDARPGYGDPCDIWEANECPEGEKCALVNTPDAEDSDANYWCRPLLGDDRLGDACSVLGAIAGNGDDTCVVGAACRAVDVASGVGLCEAMVD